MKRIEGLLAALFTPFREDGSLNLALVPELVENMVQQGAAGIFIGGTNGEGPNMTVEERMELAEAFVRVADKRLLVMVHVGHTSIYESRKLAAHAEQIGADAISSVAAFYFKPNTVSALVSSMAEIAAAAPTLPFYYYHIPVLTGVSMDMIQFLELGSRKIPTLAGIKYTASTLHEYQACLGFDNGRYDILFGYDEMLLPALAVGCRGAIGSTYSFAACLYLRIIEAYRQGDMEKARTLQGQLINMIRIFVQYPPIPAQRAIMKMLGYDLGPCRLPLQPLSSGEEDALQNQLAASGFFAQLESSLQALKV